MTRKKGLGRGLEALLGDPSDEPAGSSAASGTLPVAAIDVGRFQPRSRMDEAALVELAASITAHGVMQPVMVRPAGEGRFELIAGERRVRAATRAGLTEVPVVIREVSDHEAAILALVENLQREDLNPLEEARAVRRLVDEFGMTHDDASRSIGRSRSATTNLLRLLQLAKPVQAMLEAGEIDVGHARALLSLSAANQVTLARRVVEKKLSVRETEALASRMEHGLAKSPPTRRTRSRDVARLEEELSDLLAARVAIHVGQRGHGRLAIDFAGLDALDALIARLRR